MKLKKLIKDLSKEDEDIGIQVQPPASKKELKACQTNLAGKGFPSIPDEYIEFLRICNGFLWGLSFFGTKPFHHYSDYTYHDLVSANEDFIKYYEDFAQYLLIGEGHEKKFLYDPQKNLYRTWDYDAGLWDDYESFEAMFLYENELVEDDDDPTKSMDELLEDAKNGDTDAMWEIAENYISGESVYDKAIEWLEYAAFLGNSAAQIDLINLYNNGNEDIPKDKEKAVYWDQHSVKHYPQNQKYLDEAIAQGYGLNPEEYIMRYSGIDGEKARYWMEKADWTRDPSTIMEKIKKMEDLPDKDGG